MYDVIIIGAGPAGLTAATYTGRARLKTLVFETKEIGGYAITTDLIENYPGFPFGISGRTLMDNFWKQAQRFGSELRIEEVIKIEAGEKSHKVITNEGEYFARAIIIATGAKRKELEVEGEQEFLGRGVSYCATCDGAFFQGVPVAVVGGGDSALTEAVHLSDIASKVYLIHRREDFRANASLIEKMHSKENIELKLNKVIKKVEGDAIMQKVLLFDIKEGKEEELEVEGLFISIGMIASSDFMDGQLESNDDYIITDDKMQTSIKGIFAAGDICVKRNRQIATAVGDGANVGMAVNDYLK